MSEVADVAQWNALVMGRASVCPFVGKDHTVLVNMQHFLKLLLVDMLVDETAKSALIVQAGNLTRLIVLVQKSTTYPKVARTLDTIQVAHFNLIFTTALTLQF